MSNPPNLDDFEMNLFRKGYKIVAEMELNEKTDDKNPHKVFVNAKPLYNLFRDFGFHKEMIVRTRFRDDKHFAALYIKD